jgi:hypothetical protein
VIDDISMHRHIPWCQSMNIESIDLIFF